MVRLEECKFSNINTLIITHKPFHLSTSYVINKLKQKCHERGLPWWSSSKRICLLIQGMQV